MEGERGGVKKVYSVAIFLLYNMSAFSTLHSHLGHLAPVSSTSLCHVHTHNGLAYGPFLLLECRAHQ